ncbi:MAG: ATP-dependent DNA helicase RecG [Candidatus Moraniibacteriota bacterium]
MLDFKDDVSFVPGVGPKNAKRLHTLGIYTVEDLLYYFPFRYEDFSLRKNIAEVAIGETVTIKACIKEVKNVPLKNRKKITEAYIEDETGSLKTVWFNFLPQLKYLSKGKYIQVSGKINIFKGKELYLQHPNFEIISQKNYLYEDLNSQSLSTGILAPVYPENRNVNSYYLRKVIQKALENTAIKEFIPQDILKDQNLLSLDEAFQNIHFPKENSLASAAKERFAFEKMFLIQIRALQTKKDWDKNSAISIPFNRKIIQEFTKSLPFSLTGAQKKSSWQIIQDLEKNKPMNRLLEGDVGTGKTLVAVLAALNTSSEKFQTAILAPTEVLAVQHYHGIKEFLNNYSLKISILTSSKSECNGEKIKKEELFKKIKQGRTEIIIGTHAILQEKISFKNLALVIIDEQHRFGVNQRAFLQQKTLETDNKNSSHLPHLLTMTATPIPRSLSLALFGNLDLSIIDEYPKGKKPVITKTVPPEGRDQIYQFIRNQAKQGKQTFVICPLVEESSEMAEVKSASEEFKNLQENIFPELKIGLLHGKMKPAEKQTEMKKFKEKKYDILVSTAVVEVGVDIPEATVMLIEGAERFGLSQLHQFRGRVGRGKDQSYCFLFTSQNAPDSNSRLKAMEKTNDGFKIAEEDLKLRGPGQFMGTLQSGQPDIAMESLSDVKAIQQARIQAQRILYFDPELTKFPLLKNQLQKINQNMHWE